MSEGKRIMLTGASGFLGETVFQKLASEGFSVRPVVRSNRDSFANSIHITDLTDDRIWEGKLEEIDHIVHLSGRAHVLHEESNNPLAEFQKVNRDATLALAREAVKAGVKRFIFVSSIGVNGSETHGVPFSADDIAAPHSPYAVSKKQAEDGLLEISESTNLEVVVIRPPLILGQNPKGNLGSVMSLINKGLPLPFGLANKNSRDLVSRETLADLISACLRNPSAVGQIFLVSDGRSMTTKQLIQHLASLHDKKTRMLPIPTSILSVLLRILGKKQIASQLFGDLEIDISKTQQMLDWSPTAPYGN
jgi:UDP-N-acetyl-alpha-D-quinovosamine dehydrogenase